MLSGELQPSQKLNENAICEQLNISRTPAREALIMLAAEKMIDFVPRKGFYVKEITVEDKLQHYALLGNLDAFAAKLALRNIIDKDLINMREIAANIDVAIEFNNHPKYVELQSEFHNSYISKCGNKPLIETIQSLKERFIPVTYTQNKALSQEEYQQILYQLNAEHKEIVNLFEQRKGDKLARYIEKTHWVSRHHDLL
jgi:DNA-binding GntR family transcriptional regulator